MRVLNQTKGSVLATRVEKADDFLSRAKGLMLRKGLPDGCCMLFDFPMEGRHGIWMMGMRFSIDLLFLDWKGRVVGLFRELKPVSMDPETWKTYRPNKPARKALELPAGVIDKTGTKLGDTISLQ